MSDTGEFEDSRHVRLIPLNVEHLKDPFDMLVQRSVTYRTLEFNIAEFYERNLQEDTNLKILEERLGPWPCWRYPEGNTRIPRTVQSLYLVDSKKSFLIAALRTERDDFPLLVEPPISHTTNTFLAKETLESAVNNAGFTLQSARVYGTSEDIENRPYERLYFQGLPAFPTVFSIICAHSRFAFRFRTEATSDKPIEPPYQSTIDQCRRLVESALNPPIFPLKFIHISRILLHLAITLANSDQEQVGDLRRLYKVQKIIDNFDEMIDALATTGIADTTPQEVSNRLDRIFSSCCKGYPGSVVVRQSYAVYQKLSLSDLEDLREQGCDPGWNLTESYDNLSESSIDSEVESLPEIPEEAFKTEELREVRILDSSSSVSTLSTSHSKRKTFTRKADTSSHRNPDKYATFECKICHKAFSRSWNLNRHLRTHSSQYIDKQK